MPPQLELNAEPRRPRGPEPLRRKRVQPVPALDGRRRKLLNLLLGFAAVVLLVDALIGEKGFMDRMRAKREYQLQQAKLETLWRENQTLAGRATRLKTDPAAIESIAREEMGLMKKGELLFIVRDVKPAARPSTTKSPD